MPRILVVEDDTSMAVALQDGFSYEGFEVDLAADGSNGLRLANERNPDVIVLDVMLPKLSGIDVCKRIRQNNNLVPIIMLTARGQEADKVAGLKSGADDYVTKPFSFLELFARVEAVLRRAQGSADLPDTYEFGNISIDFRKTSALKDGKNLLLSPREFKLLRFMIDHRGEVLARERLLDAVWGYDNVPFTRTVDMHIAKLRKKIEDRPQDPTLIVTVHRVGYRFNG
jgi:two-component system alkaline phosphatase synthesis response regulator PhoP